MTLRSVSMYYSGDVENKRVSEDVKKLFPKNLFFYVSHIKRRGHVMTTIVNILISKAGSKDRKKGD